VGFLELLYKKHKLWIRYLLKMGCPKDLCEDITQEMYIKIDTYLKKNNNNIKYGDDVNVYFIYLTLRSLYTDYHRKLKNVKMVEINETILGDIETEVSNENLEDYNINLDKKISIEEWYNDQLYLDLLENEDLQDVNYTKEELEKYYLRRIFKEVFYDDVQVSKLSKDTNITYWSLRNTINIIKKQIKKKYEIRKRTRKDI